MKIVRDDIFNGLKEIFKDVSESTLNKIRDTLRAAGKSEDEINQQINEILQKTEETAIENASKWTNYFVSTFVGRVKKSDSYYDLTDSVNVKVITNNDNIKLMVRPNVRTVQLNTEITSDDEIVLVDTSGSVVITLPDVSSANNKMFIIKNVNIGSVTLQPAGTASIYGLANFVLSAKNQAVVVVSNGTDWYIIGSYQGGV